MTPTSPPSGPVPFVVVADLVTLGAVRSELRAAGWALVDGLDHTAVRPGPPRTRVLTGTVSDAWSATTALLSAVRGSGLAVHLAAVPMVAERFVEDLLRLGAVEVRPPTPTPVLDGEDVALLRLLADGATVGEAARALHLSLRTVHRRLGVMRAALGLPRTAQLVTHARRAGLLDD